MEAYNKLIEMGEKSEREGKYKEAIEYYNKAFKLDSGRGGAFYYISTLHYLRLKDINKAIFYIKKAIEIEPDMPLYWKNLGNFLLDLGEKGKALFSLLKSFEINKDRELAEKILTLKNQNIIPENPLAIEVRLQEIPLSQIYLISIREELEEKCFKFIETKKCPNCNKEIPVWVYFCNNCKVEIPIPAKKSYSTYKINQMDLSGDKIILNYAGEYYIEEVEGKSKMLGRSIFEKIYYEDILVFFKKLDIIWNKKLNASIKYLSFVPDQDKILVITPFTKDETLLNPLDGLIKKSKKEYNCELCKKTILKGSSYWNGYMSFLNKIDTPYMFSGVIKICMDCRPVKEDIEISRSHVYLLDYNGNILMDYKNSPYLVDNIRDLQVKFYPNNQFTVFSYRIFDHLFDSEKNELLKANKWSF